jgi:hypothetical protein
VAFKKRQMRAILVFSPYILVPLLVTLLCRRFSVSWHILTYLITAVIIFFYPFALFWLDDYLNPPTPGPQCGNPQMGFVLGNIIIFLPSALLLQYVFNNNKYSRIRNKNNK